MLTYAEQIAQRWTLADAKPYARGDIQGECLPMVSTIDLPNLPWDEAPTLPTIEAKGGGLLCVKRSRHRCVLTFTITGAMGQDIRLYVKRCKPSQSVFKQVGNIFGRQSKSQREWKLGWDLMQRDIPTAVPLLWADERKSGKLKASYYISLGLEGTVSFRSIYESVTEEHNRIIWMAYLGAFIRMAHEKGFAHDDLSTDHVLVATNSLDPKHSGHPRFFFIDLDGSRTYHEPVGGYRRAHNFFQVFRSLPKEKVTDNQRKGFYNGYSEGKWSDEHIETFEHTIEMISLQKKLGRMFKPGKWFKK